MTISIEGYEVGEKIGEGGMALVYRARHIRLDREVALKLLLPEYSDDDSFAERFLREARIAAKLNHPNIVQIYDVDKCGEHLFLSMELVEGGDFASRLQQHQPSKTLVIEAFGQLCAALDYAHSQGYIHRDIKPANILFRKDGSLALSDFGIARAIRSDHNMTTTGMVVGTPSYMSPEQAQSDPVDGRADFYALGVISYQVVTGQLPYQADSAISLAVKHINAPIPQVPPSLASMQPFFDKALAKSPGDRFINGADFLRHFDSAYASVDTSSYRAYQSAENPAQPSAPQPTVRTPAPGKVASAGGKKSWLPGVAIGVVAAAAIAGGVVMWPMIKPDPGLSPAQQARLAQLLRDADDALSEGRLVLPENDNAHQYFLDIMALSPNDPEAESGVQKVIAQLRVRANDAVAEEDLQLATETLAHLERLDGTTDYSALKQAIEQLELTGAEPVIEAETTANAGYNEFGAGSLDIDLGTAKTYDFTSSASSNVQVVINEANGRPFDAFLFNQAEYETFLAWMNSEDVDQPDLANVAQWVGVTRVNEKGILVGEGEFHLVVDNSILGTTAEEPGQLRITYSMLEEY